MTDFHYQLADFDIQKPIIITHSEYVWCDEKKELVRVETEHVYYDKKKDSNK